MLIKQKVYRVIDNGKRVLTTLDELKALRKYQQIMEAKEQVNTWGWIETEDLN